VNGGTRIVLVGTGTGIGKTHAGVALVKALAFAGLEVAGLKPVESGVGTGISDAGLLAEAGTFHVKQLPPYRLAAPLSPHLAAPLEGTTIRLAPIVRWIDAVDARWLVIETAGALLSPLAPGLTNLDLAAALEPDHVLLVAPDRLGVLHDVTAALFALHHLAPQLPEPTVLLQPPPEADASTGTNARELLILQIARRVVTLPRARPESASTQSTLRDFLRLVWPTAFQS
jgi:dethiobiotin synthetase